MTISRGLGTEPCAFSHQPHSSAPKPRCLHRSHPLAHPTCHNGHRQMQKERFYFSMQNFSTPPAPRGCWGIGACGSADGMQSPSITQISPQVRPLPKGPKNTISGPRFPPLALLPFLVFQPFLAWMEQEEGTAPAPCPTWLVCMCAQHQNRHMCESHGEEVKSSDCTVLQMQKHLVGRSLLQLSKHFI